MKGSLTEMKVNCTVAGEGKKINCHQCHVIPIYQKKSHIVKTETLTQVIMKEQNPRYLVHETSRLYHSLNIFYHKQKASNIL
jgi:hypothetical protein